MLHGVRVRIPKIDGFVKQFRGKQLRSQTLSSKPEASGQHIGKIFPKAFPEKTVRVMTDGCKIQEIGAVDHF